MTIRALPAEMQIELGLFQECLSEFGPHEDHEECNWLIAQMNAPYPDYPDYSDWYGGEQGYRDGLRWSDFV
jgi:hypothetical protein